MKKIKVMCHKCLKNFMLGEDAVNSSLGKFCDKCLEKYITIPILKKMAENGKIKLSNN